MTQEEAYFELLAYTLTHGDPAFIHQYVVDAHAVQSAAEGDKPIAVVFGLVGLYLHLERGFTGREVQLAHMKLARKRETWPTMILPPDRGAITSIDVLAVAEGAERDAKIDAWCASVWEAFAVNRAHVISFLSEREIS